MRASGRAGESAARERAGGQSARCGAGWWLAVIAMGVIGAGVTVGAVAQTQEPATDKPAAAAVAVEARKQEGQELYLQGATLDTDSDAEALLRRAQEEVAAGHYREAMALLQHLLDQRADKLVSTDGQTCRPAGACAESVLAELPAEALRLYRLTADASAQGLYRRFLEHHDEEALREILRRFAISSLGDRAAFDLACLLLDRGEFGPAQRWLEWVRNSFPQSGIPRWEVDLRLVLTKAWLDQCQEARRELERLEYPADPEVVQRVEQVRALIERRCAEAERATGKDVSGIVGPVGQGGAWREGRTVAFPGEVLAERELWLIQWSYRTDLVVPPDELPADERRAQEAGLRQRPQSRNRLMERWQQAGWFPTSRIVVAGERLYFRTHRGLVCLDSATGKPLWRLEDPSLLQRISPRHYLPPSVASLRGPTASYPATAEEVAFFGDRVSRAITVIGKTVYQIENHAPWAVASQVRLALPGGMSPGFPANDLAAVDAATGSVRWRVRGAGIRLGPEGELRYEPGTMEPQPEDDSTIPQGGLRFQSPPIDSGGHLIAPATLGENLYLLALERENGRLVWAKWLCSGPTAGIALWSPVGLAARGGIVFVATGRGVVFAIEAGSGQVLWAARYPRPAVSRLENQPLPVRRFAHLVPAGWQEDVVISVGEVVAVLPSDSPLMVGLDRRTGRLMYQRPSQGARYVVGLFQDRLIVAGNSIVRAVDVGSGQTVWEVALEWSLGCGVLAGDVVIVPEEGKPAVDFKESASGRYLVCLEAASGREIARIRLTGSIVSRLGGRDSSGLSEPIGNVLTDGRRLYVAALGQVDALTNLRLRLEELDRWGQGGRREAMWERARLLADAGRLEEATETIHRWLAETRAAAGSGAAEAQRQLAQGRGLLFAVLLERARRSDVPMAQAKRFLDEAGDLIDAEWQRLVLGLARADLMERTGRLIQAAEVLVDLAMTSTPLFVPMPDDPAVEVLVSRLAAWKLKEILQQAGEARGGLEQRLERSGSKALEEAISSGGNIGRLLAVARAHPGTDSSFRAMVLAARHAVERGELEQAEMILQELARAESPVHAAGGLAALARFHEQVHGLRQAAMDWQRLAREFPDVRLTWEDVRETAAKLAARELERLCARDPMVLRQMRNAQARVLVLRGMEGPPNRVLWRLADPTSAGRYRLLTGWQPRVSQWLEEHMLVADGPWGWPRRLICVQARTGRQRWEYVLPRSAGGESRCVIFVGGVPAMTGGTGLIASISAGLDGEHVALLVDGRSITALGLMTGQVLWSVPAEWPVMSARMGGGDVLGEWTMGVEGSAVQGAVMIGAEPEGTALAVGEGMLVRLGWDVRDWSDQIEAVDLVEGLRVWRRRLEGAGAVRLSSGGGLLRVALAQATEGTGSSGEREKESVMLCDLRTGRAVGFLDMADHVTRWSPVAWGQQTVIYNTARGLVCRRVPEGQVMWIFGTQGRLVRPLWLNERLLAALGQDGRCLYVLEASTGKLVLELASPAGDQVDQRYMDLALSAEGKEVYVVGGDSQGHRSIWRVNLEEGRVKGRLLLEGASRQVAFPQPSSAAYVAAGDPWLALVQVAVLKPRGATDAQPGPGRTGRWSLRLFDLREGREIQDYQAPLPEEMTGGPLAGPPIVQNGVLVIAGQRGLVALGHEP